AWPRLAGLELRNLPASASRVLWIKGMSHHTWLHHLIFNHHHCWVSPPTDRPSPLPLHSLTSAPCSPRLHFHADSYLCIDSLHEID
uniref:Uncharacterized protein n=1 Tax=Mus spicilegus TaxID=10103 RepID=A0A8C6I500_MUSSI